MSYDWQKLMSDWSRILIALNNFKVWIPPEAIASQWLGYPGATEEEITQAETRLSTRLPKSFLEFLQVSNGWLQLNEHIYNLLSTTQIDWLHQLQPHWFENFDTNYPPVPDEDYFVYGGNQAAYNVRWEYLKTALQISDVGNAAFLVLNPQIVTPEGEWEVWYVASWKGGATRYRSFGEMMQAEYKNHANALAEKERQ